jgi:hypothetical protein
MNVLDGLHCHTAYVEEEEMIKGLLRQKTITSSGEANYSDN